MLNFVTVMGDLINSPQNREKRRALRRNAPPVESNLTRQHYFQSLGLRVVCFQNAQIDREMDFVFENLLA